MVCRLISFIFVVLKLFIFTLCGIIGISKIEFFNFSGTERVNVIYSFCVHVGFCAKHFMWSCCLNFCFFFNWTLSCVSYQYSPLFELLKKLLFIKFFLLFKRSLLGCTIIKEKSWKNVKNKLTLEKQEILESGSIIAALRVLS